MPCVANNNLYINVALAGNEEDSAANAPVIKLCS